MLCVMLLAAILHDITLVVSNISYRRSVVAGGLCRGAPGKQPRVFQLVPDHHCCMPCAVAMILGTRSTQQDSLTYAATSWLCDQPWKSWFSSFSVSAEAYWAKPAFRRLQAGAPSSPLPGPQNDNPDMHVNGWDSI